MHYFNGKATSEYWVWKSVARRKIKWRARERAHTFTHPDQQLAEFEVTSLKWEMLPLAPAAVISRGCKKVCG